MLTAADAVSATPTSLEQVLQTAYDRFKYDQTILMPLNGGNCVIDHRGTFTLQQTHQADHLWLLSCHNIGVLCGPRSSDLACIRFDSQSERADFLTRPALQGTLLTSSPAGCYVWVRIEGWYPANHKHPSCDWIADQIVVIAYRQKDADCRFDNDRQPVTLTFKEIAWPSQGLAMIWASKFAKEEYEILLFDKHGVPVLNDDFVIAMFMSLHANTFFNPVSGTFYQRVGGGQVRTVYAEEVKRWLHEVLAYVRKGAYKPPADEAISTGKTALRIDTGVKQLASLMELLKILAVKPVAAQEASMDEEEEEAKAFDQFILTRLEQARGETVTVGEAYAAYADYCAAEDQPFYSARQFHERLAKCVKRDYGIDKNHSTIRNGQSKRGFRNLRLKAGQIVLPTENFGTTGTTGTAFVEGADRCPLDLTTSLAVAE